MMLPIGQPQGLPLRKHSSNISCVNFGKDVPAGRLYNLT